MMATIRIGDSEVPVQVEDEGEGIFCEVLPCEGRGAFMRLAVPGARVTAGDTDGILLSGRVRVTDPDRFVIAFDPDEAVHGACGFPVRLTLNSWQHAEAADAVFCNLLFSGGSMLDTLMDEES
jgi:hypothetical protein